MRQTKLLGLGMAVALMVVACGGGPTVEAAGSPLGSPIAVHGDWTIEVYNADGTLDQQHEFSNALLPNGAATLALILAGNRLVPGDSAYHVDIDYWIIGVGQYDELSGTIGQSPCDDLIGAGTASMNRGCVLAADVSLSGDNSDILTLSGSVESDTDGFINYVVTATQRGEHFAGGASSGSRRYFTGTSYEPEISVAAGQTIQIQVDISFTSG